MYINLLTDEYIPDSSVVRDGAEGLTIYEDGCWKLLAPDTYRKVNEEKGSGSYTPITTLTDNMGKIASDKTGSKVKKRFYTEYFGINNVTVEKKRYATTSGVVSGSIEVVKGTPIKLLADVVRTGLSSVEFYILDGTREVPIMPAGEEKVMHEKLFFYMPLRFNGTDIEYYNNGTLVDAVTDDMRVNGTATACYVPDKHSYSYTPENDTIRVKIIIRMPKAADRAPEISNIRIEREV